jgi:ABC-type dipeptide/oligopeptide/nickel transport system permease subunit
MLRKTGLAREMASRVGVSRCPRMWKITSRGALPKLAFPFPLLVAAVALVVDVLAFLGFGAARTTAHQVSFVCFLPL